MCGYDVNKDVGVADGVADAVTAPSALPLSPGTFSTSAASRQRYSNLLFQNGAVLITNNLHGRPK
jgi:hypothetical protein